MSDRRFDAVVFDLDGTLCDSEPFIAAAAAEALRRRYGIAVSVEDFAPFVGAGDDRYISGAAALHGVTADLAIDKPLTYAVYLELIPGALQPIAGARGFIDALHAAGLRLALATGSDRQKLHGNLAAIGLGEADFDVVVSQEDVARRKPDPEMFLVAAERLGLDPARCLVVEDARNGVLAGRAAGCEVLGIASSQDPTALREAGAVTVVRDYTEIPPALLADLALDRAGAAHEPSSRRDGRYDVPMTDLVLTLIGPDHPGIVDALSEVVAAHDGNWLESRMAHLAGKFAGVLCVEVPDDRAAALEEALGRLEAGGLRVVVERSAPAEAVRQHAMEIELLGLDRPGLVHEISALLAEHRINVEELATGRSAAAHSGDAMFRAQVRVAIPEDVDVAAVRRGLERLAGDLMVEIRLAEDFGSSR